MERPAPLAKLASDEFLPVNRRYFVEKHLRTSLMKRPLGRKHFLHQSGLRSGEDIAHLSLLLNLVAQDIFNRAPVEFGNLLKFIKADCHAKSRLPGQFSRQRENLWSDRGRIESRSLTEGQTDLAAGQVVVNVGLDAPPKSRDPIFHPLPRPGGPQNLLGELFQQLGVTRVAAHR